MGKTVISSRNFFKLRFQAFRIPIEDGKKAFVLRKFYAVHAWTRHNASIQEFFFCARSKKSFFDKFPPEINDNRKGIQDWWIRLEEIKVEKRSFQKSFTNLTSSWNDVMNINSFSTVSWVNKHKKKKEKEKKNVNIRNSRRTTEKSLEEIVLTYRINIKFYQNTS